jgi:hypothetical protein
MEIAADRPEVQLVDGLMRLDAWACAGVGIRDGDQNASGRHPGADLRIDFAFGLAERAADESATAFVARPLERACNVGRNEPR